MHSEPSSSSSASRSASLPLIGWREWLKLPELNIPRIKVKVDTGARSSSLHAFNIQQVERDGVPYVRFEVHPRQRSDNEVVNVEWPVLEYRSVRSSSGEAAHRPVIVTEVEIMGMRWPIELTLANRDQMGFRMLLGREAVRGRFVVDAGNSFLGGRPKRKRKKK